MGGGGRNSLFIFGYRELEVYISIIACTLGNITFIPLNPKFPKERLKNIIERASGAPMILAPSCIESFRKIADSLPSLLIFSFEESLQDEFPNHEWITIPNLQQETQSKQQDLVQDLAPAYLLFTSGSTGIPKGVLVSRANLTNYCQRIQSLYHFAPQDRISQFFDITFDLSMHDIFCTLLCGATLVVIPHKVLFNPIPFIASKKIHILFVVPSLLAYLQKFKALKPNALPMLRAALFCGEALPLAAALEFAKVAPNALLDNLYGPTEATISFTQYRLIAEGGIGKCGIPTHFCEILPLGLPYKGLHISLRDEKGLEIPQGEVGEIWLGGDQVSLGYYKDADKTREKFIVENEVCWYKTGDLGKFDDTLNAYCFCGRIDEQVKVQGFRVELLEIDNALYQASGTQSRAILLEKDGLSSLYGICETSAIDSKQILEALRTKLPFYMLPSKILALEKFPLNSNGKVDRKAIKQWAIQNLESQNPVKSNEPPQTKPHNKDAMDFLSYGEEMLALTKKLFKIPRSLSGNGNRETLKILQELLPNLKIYEVPSRTKAFDWEIPKEWNVKDAYILTPSGEKICDFKENNLHLMGYSIPCQCALTFKELESHLYSLENQPSAIPYITSYYKERWGFCLSFEEFCALKEKYKDSQKKFQIHIDSHLESGNLSYAELYIQGKSKQEIVFSTYICHPQMVNNELSGIALACALGKILSQRENPYSIRILFLPETIGSIYYLSRHLEHLQASCIAGFVLTCIGDSRSYSVLHSREGNNLADRAAKHVLTHYYKGFKEYSYLDRGSDERQYCAPNVDLPFATLMRTKFGAYPEYHTSLDDLSLVSAQSFADSLQYVWRILRALELNGIYQNTILCEPQLGKRGLYPTLSTKDSINQIKDMRNLLMYCDGKKDLLEIAEICNIDLLIMQEWIEKFLSAKLITKVGQ
ncbi:DUF4910 domain-containing protein [uncultured Helicobacter sp.]|uniref:DUF4910 domain-containing protein n=1 Tax=uncultured Helicobacter sp. TaxID=175537 RepID=UPI00261A452D|nr:DUF4910 domain-containing protein [uncultured Helicobacter sp.]